MTSMSNISPPRGANARPAAAPAAGAAVEAGAAAPPPPREHDDPADVTSRMARVSGVLLPYIDAKSDSVQWSGSIPSAQFISRLTPLIASLLSGTVQSELFPCDRAVDVLRDFAMLLDVSTSEAGTGKHAASSASSTGSPTKKSALPRASVLGLSSNRQAKKRINSQIGRKNGTNTATSTAVVGPSDSAVRDDDVVDDDEGGDSTWTMPSEVLRHTEAVCRTLHSEALKRANLLEIEFAESLGGVGPGFIGLTGLSWEQFSGFLVDAAITSSHDLLTVDTHFFIPLTSTKFSVACRFALTVDVDRILIVECQNASAVPEAIVVELPSFHVVSRAFWPSQVKDVVLTGVHNYACVSELSLFFVEQRFGRDVVGTLSIEALGHAPNCAYWWDPKPVEGALRSSSLVIGGLWGQLWFITPPVFQSRLGSWSKPVIETASTVAARGEPLLAIREASAAGQLLLITSKGRLIVYNADQDVVLSERNGAEYGLSIAMSAALSTMADTVVVGGEAPFLQAWQTRNSPAQTPVVLNDSGAPHTSHVLGIIASPATSMLASIDGHGLLKIWDFDTLQCTQSIRVGMLEADFVALLMVGEMITIVMQRQCVVYQVDQEHLQCPVRGLIRHPKSGTIMGAAARDVLEFSAKHGRRVTHHRGITPRDVISIQFTPDGNTMFLLTSVGDISVHSASTGKRLSGISKRFLESEPLAMDFCTTLHRLVVITVDSLVWFLAPVTASGATTTTTTAPAANGSSPMMRGATSSPPQSHIAIPTVQSHAQNQLMSPSVANSPKKGQNSQLASLPTMSFMLDGDAPLCVTLRPPDQSSTCLSVGRVDNGMEAIFIGTTENGVQIWVAKSRSQLSFTHRLQLPSKREQVASIVWMDHSLVVGDSGGNIVVFLLRTHRVVDHMNLNDAAWMTHAGAHAPSDGAVSNDRANQIEISSSMQWQLSASALSPLGRAPDSAGNFLSSAAGLSIGRKDSDASSLSAHGSRRSTVVVVDSSPTDGKQPSVTAAASNKPPLPIAGDIPPHIARNVSTDAAPVYPTVMIPFDVGAFLLIGDNTGHINILSCFRKQSLRLVQRFRVYDDAVTGVVVENDIVFTTSRKNTLNAWTLTGRSLATLWGSTQPTAVVSLLPDDPPPAWLQQYDAAMARATLQQSEWLSALASERPDPHPSRRRRSSAAAQGANVVVGPPQAFAGGDMEGATTGAVAGGVSPRRSNANRSHGAVHQTLRDAAIEQRLLDPTTEAAAELGGGDGEAGAVSSGGDDASFGSTARPRQHLAETDDHGRTAHDTTNNKGARASGVASSPTTTTRTVPLAVILGAAVAADFVQSESTPRVIRFPPPSQKVAPPSRGGGGGVGAGAASESSSGGSPLPVLPQITTVLSAAPSSNALIAEGDGDPSRGSAANNTKMQPRAVSSTATPFQQLPSHLLVPASPLTSPSRGGLQLQQAALTSESSSNSFLAAQTSSPSLMLAVFWRKADDPDVGDRAAGPERVVTVNAACHGLPALTAAPAAAPSHRRTGGRGGANTHGGAAPRLRRSSVVTIAPAVGSRRGQNDSSGLLSNPSAFTPPPALVDARASSPYGGSDGSGVTPTNRQPERKQPKLLVSLARRGGSPHPSPETRRSLSHGRF